MNNLKRIRTAAGISQSQLAEMSGVNVRMIQYYEQGVKDINAAGALTVYKLAKALKCSMEELVEKRMSSKLVLFYCEQKTPG